MLKLACKCKDVECRFKLSCAVDMLCSVISTASVGFIFGLGLSLGGLVATHLLAALYGTEFVECKSKQNASSAVVCSECKDAKP